MWGMTYKFWLAFRITDCHGEQQFLPEKGSYLDGAQFRKKDIHQKWTSSIGSKQGISIGLDDEMVKAKGRLGMNR